MTQPAFSVEIDADGIALATWDVTGRSMNVITPAVMEELAALVERVAADPAIKGCVITSGKESFSGGADLTMLQGLAEAYEETARRDGEEAAMRHFFEESRRLTLLYRRLETCGKPFAIAIHGVCLGGAFELALACHRRILSDDAATRVGLPEIKVGLFPGAGGTQRVSRLMPTGDALQMLFKGEQIRPPAALKMNLVHEVVPRAEIVARAKAWIRDGGKPVAPWDEPQFRLPSGKVHSAQGMMIWPAANAIYRRETQDNYPAAKAILQVVYEGLQLPIDLALRVESRHFARILRSREAAAMIRTLFVSMQDLNKGARRPAGIPPTILKTVGVVGAGFMGAGIAYVAALAGLDVVLIDRDQETADKGKAQSHALMTGQIARGRARTADRDALLQRITATADYAALAACDLVVEAVFEDPGIKAETLKRIAAAVPDRCIIASNTSTLPIGGLAGHSGRAADFIGIHFFSPVEKMMLVEIILGPQTGERALATALDFVRAIRKTPIVVHDGRGFYANRCVGRYLHEGHLMLLEGVPPAMIENAAKMAGMPVGPLALNDEVAIDLALRILRATKAQLGADAIDARQEALLTRMVEGHGRLGRKNGKGFYDYPEQGRGKRLWPGLSEFAAAPRDPDSLSVKELKDRFLFVQALEACRAVEDGIVTDPREADVGAILGFGFAPHTGGPLSMIDGLGANAALARARQLAAAHGKRFEPPAVLQDLAAKGETFYGRFGAAGRRAA
jgi:3-hydroxyacyl-CoA dehydrogenase/enoyl-CoA hydratase/3-hydroxybutyryl-CoA epimerase